MTRSHDQAHTDFVALVARITYQGLSIEVVHEKASAGVRWHVHRGHYLRIVCDEGSCNVTGEPMRWKGRKFRLSRHMTEMEVVNTAFLAILTALEHEARERFRVDGVAVMDSHRDLELTLAFMGGTA